ncbi:hypothetical protein INR49_012825 [Caranx melampygus]|nr:hypothetical protein INR49_012825 [Caranx melampygus]
MTMFLGGKTHTPPPPAEGLKHKSYHNKASKRGPCTLLCLGPLQDPICQSNLQAIFGVHFQSSTKEF